MEMLEAWERRDAAYDGLFVLGVRTTGIFCRPSCPSQPSAAHLEFFESPVEAARAGYRPCLRCEPTRLRTICPDWMRPLLQRLESTPLDPVSSAELRSMKLSPERVRRWFLKHHGLSFAAWHRQQRLSQARTAILAGVSLDDAVFDHGYDSHSGFRSSYARTFGTTPGAVREQATAVLTARTFDSAWGGIFAAATEQAVCHLQFLEVNPPALALDRIRANWNGPVVVGTHALLDRLLQQLQEYFERNRRDFDVPTAPRGTPFQQQVWQTLKTIPFGETRSYEDIARAIGRPSAVRAVARANATNPIQILIPCHRVIAKSGALSGYSGGVWRKQKLLELERNPPLPRPRGD